MPRTPLTASDRMSGRALGELIKQARGTRTAADVAAAAGVPLDTLRKLERGGVAAPGFFLVVRLAAALGRPLDDFATAAHHTGKDDT